MVESHVFLVDPPFSSSHGGRHYPRIPQVPTSTCFKHFQRPFSCIVIFVFAPIRSAFQCYCQGASVSDVWGLECQGGGRVTVQPRTITSNDFTLPSNCRHSPKKYVQEPCFFSLSIPPLWGCDQDLYKQQKWRIFS